jgi:hypothetical protein
MARVKKDREPQVIHFSFFDVLFGAFGAFVFLMIMQVISSLNLVDLDVRRVIDEAVQERNALREELSRKTATEQALTALKRQLEAAMEERIQNLAEQERLARQNRELSAQVESLQNEVASLEQIMQEFRRKGSMQEALEEENRKLKQDLDQARQQLASVKIMPLKLKTGVFPSTFTGEKLSLALAAEGGVPPYTWELEGDLPKGLSLDPMAGMILGVANDTGEFRFSTRVTDALRNSAESESQVFNVVEKPEPQKRGVSRTFLVLSVVTVLLLLYIFWQKYRARQYMKEMERKGFRLNWVK